MTKKAKKQKRGEKQKRGGGSMRQRMPLEVRERGLSLTCDSHQVVLDMSHVTCDSHYVSQMQAPWCTMHPHHIFTSFH